MPRRWPGLSVREFLLAEGAQISIPAPDGLLAMDTAVTGSALNYKSAKTRAIVEFEGRYLASLLQQANGNVSAAARISGTERRQLGRLLKKYSIRKFPSQL